METLKVNTFGYVNARLRRLCPSQSTELWGCTLVLSTHFGGVLNTTSLRQHIHTQSYIESHRVLRVPLRRAKWALSRP